jgi:uncharacterized protein YndB with AHSA1/START domain
MNTTKITIQAVVAADRQKVWACYTQPEHITKWNFAGNAAASATTATTARLLA